MQQPDEACAVAHGDAPPESHGRTLIAVFASPVSDFLLRYGGDLGFGTVLMEPDPARAEAATASGAPVVGALPELDEAAHVVVTDHHRAELGVILRDALKTRAGWIGIMGNPRHEGPHVQALTALGVAPEEIARVHRPIGLNIGSRTPPEIAIATLAGLIAEHNGRPGGFHF